MSERYHRCAGVSFSTALPSQALTRQLSQRESLWLYYITNALKTEANFDDQRKDRPHQRAGTQEQDRRPDRGRKTEQQALRKEYIEDMKSSLRAQLEHTSIKEPDGTIHKVSKKN